MVLDEVVYLITTDGSNAACLTPISLWGAIILVFLTSVLIVIAHLMVRARLIRRQLPEAEGDITLPSSRMCKGHQVGTS